MLNSLKALKNTTLDATDGEIGRCEDFLFDDRRWVLRYRVADTGKWIPDRKVVISPHFLTEVDASASRVSARLTRDQIEESPPLAAHEPVSAQREAEVAKYYESMPTWPATVSLAWSGLTMAFPVRMDDPAPLGGDPRLRSLDEVLGYRIHATDGEVGRIADLMVESDDWSIPYLVVETGTWLSGKAVLVSPNWVERFDWANQIARLDLSTSLIEASPEYPPVESESLLTGAV